MRRPAAHDRRVRRRHAGVLIAVVRVAERYGPDRVREARHRVRRVVDRQVTARVAVPVQAVTHVRGERRVARIRHSVVGHLAALKEQLPAGCYVALQSRPVRAVLDRRSVVAGRRDDEVVVCKPRARVGCCNGLLRHVVAQSSEVGGDLAGRTDVVRIAAPDIDDVPGLVDLESLVSRRRTIRYDQDVGQRLIEHEVLGHGRRAHRDAPVLRDVVIRAHVHLVVEVRKRHRVGARRWIGRCLRVQGHVVRAVHLHRRLQRRARAQLRHRARHNAGRR